MSANSVEPTIRLARKADGPRCNDFYNRYYGRSRSLKQWEWEFCRPVLGGETIPFAIAEHDGEVVGTQALIPIELIDSAGTYWSAKSEETLVAESMRGRGLFHKLYEPLIEFAREHRLQSIWGFTPARAAFEREGFSCPTRTSQLVRAFTSRAADALLATSPQTLPGRFRRSLASTTLATYGTLRSTLGKARTAPGIELKVLDAPADWMDSLSAEFSSEWGGTTLHRTAAYTQWRFFENPFRRPTVLAAFARGRPVGWVAFGVGENGTGALVDLVAISPPGGESSASVVTTLVAAATDRTRDMGASAIRAWDVSGHPFAAAVKTCAQHVGWIHVDRGFDMVLKFTPGIPPRPDAQPIDNWYVTRAYNEGSDV